MYSAQIIHKLFTHKENKQFFPHIRQDYIARMIKKQKLLVHQVNQDIAGAIIWLQYQRQDPRQIGNKGDIQLKQIVVHPDYKKHGIGIKLFQKLEELAIHLNAPNICLSVRATNTIAQNFYIKMGMQVTRTIEWQEQGKPLPGLVYSKQMPGNDIVFD
jgi:ribosomal protein S18 acetylase RimI-like enzyme